MACPTPRKIRHATKTQAEAQMLSLSHAKGGAPDLHVYPCRGHWHVGHSQVLLRKRIRRALRGNR